MLATLNTIHNLLQDVGEWTGEASVQRGAITLAGTLAGVLFAGWRWLRKPRRRSMVRIDCEPGEKVFVQLGEDEKDE